MRFLFFLLIAYIAYKFLKVVVGMFFTTSFDLKNKSGRGFNFYSNSPKTKKNGPARNPQTENQPINKKDIIDAEFEEIKESQENSK